MPAAARGDGEHPGAAVGAKVKSYEDFIENVLEKELLLSVEEVRKQSELLEQCRELRSNINLLVSGCVTELETIVDVGCQFYADAFVPDTSTISVDVGLGFYLEMPLADALGFLEEKEAHLLDGLALRAARTSRVKADIHQALHLLDMLAHLQSGPASSGFRNASTARTT